MAASNPEQFITKSQWSLILEIVSALEPARKATEAPYLRRFYGIWLKCKLEITDMTSAEFEKLLLVCLNKRDLALQEHDVFRLVYFLILDTNTAVRKRKESSKNPRKRGRLCRCWKQRVLLIQLHHIDGLSKHVAVAMMMI